MTHHPPSQLQPSAILFMIGVLLFLAYGCGGGEEPRVLVFSKTAGYRHASIESGQDMFRRLGEEHDFGVDVSEDAAVFTKENLARYRAVVFLSTTGDILDNAQEMALQRYVEGGGNWLGIHAAADTEYEWPWYNQLAGAYFESHPKGTPEATIRVLNSRHPATRGLKDRWTRTDEWYNYKSIQPGMNVLMELDETTYEGGKNGANHPIAWYREIGQGRMFYTGLGHTEASYSEPEFVAHVYGGLQYLLDNNKRVRYALAGDSLE
ncbi:ThuA domain-containing protein [Neolewinella litorea]|uniref:ThuA domain-containing protein n=1 Tax=Neolewinella litorea TaxID=2562452 RepID=A0A4S4NUU1_9BACT|nr:ThuA domain-containing protein [Neolewinella litorea]THH40010.1 ThuA domain-containing protein [Neolewinella litorea]